MKNLCTRLVWKQRYPSYYHNQLPHSIKIKKLKRLKHKILEQHDVQQLLQQISILKKALGNKEVYQSEERAEKERVLQMIRGNNDRIEAHIREHEELYKSKVK